MIVRHCGDDVRYRPFQNAVHSRFGIHQWQNAKRNIIDAWTKLYKQRIAESTAIVLSSRDHATFQKRDLFVRPYIQEKMCFTKGFESKKPFVLHAPSDPKIKGTHIVEKAINKLHQKNLDFEFSLLTNVPHSFVLENLKKTTILIDQPGGFPARLAHEGIASGCVVIGGNCRNIHQLDELPIIQFPSDPEQLADILEDLINNPKKCEVMGRKAIDYWINNNSPESFRRYFAELLQGDAQKFSTIEGHYHFLQDSCCNRWERFVVKISSL